MRIKPIGFALCLFVLLIPLASASETTESFTIYTERTEYLVGELINVYAKAEAIDPNQTITITDVVVYNPENLSVVEWRNISIVFVDTTTSQYIGTVVATSEGEYTVSANATGCPWILRAIWRFFCRRLNNTVPEVPLGPIMASILMVAAFGAYFELQKRKIRP